MYKSPFESDPRNLGGRTTTANKMYNHQKALNDIKPSINTKDQPAKHVDAGKVKKPLLYQQQQTYGNVYKTFEAVGNIDKPLINTKKPETMNLKHMNTNIDKPKKRDNKLNKHLDFEHQKHIQSQQRRINAIGSTQERKKNPHDPIANPVIIFRRGDDKKGVNQYMKTQGQRSVQLGISRPQSSMVNSSYAKEGGRKMNYASQIQQTQKGGHKQTDMEEIREWYRHKDVEKNNLKPVHDKNKQKRPLTGKEKKELDALQEEVKEDFIYEIPKTQADDEEDYNYVKMRTIEIIVKYRIFSNEDLKVLEGRTLLHNKHMDRLKLEQIFQEINDDLNS